MASRFEEKIEKIEKLDKSTEPVNPIEAQEEIQRVPPNKERFDNLMVAEDQKKFEYNQKIADTKVDPTSPRNSLFDEARQLSSKTDNLKITPTQLIAQTDQAVNKMEQIKTQLQTPGVEIKDSASTLLRNKLEHINENINVVVSKTGSEFSQTPVVPTTTGPLTASSNPVLRFLGLLTDGQAKLQTLGNDVEKWHLNGKEIAPATMLAMQIKVNYINQELEFFSSLLNKALESTKTIMNVQV